MPTEVTLLSAFLIGLLGSTHCAGMCSGIMGAFTLSVRGAGAPARALAPYLLAYNLGRIGSYAAAGALLGLASAQLFDLVPGARVGAIAGLVAAAFMLGLGFYFACGWNGLAGLERLGGKLWTHIEPVGRKLLPINHPGKAFLFGTVWGWLPCGLVYATLAWSLASGSAMRGAAVMTAFGLGTLPMLLAVGTAARWLKEAAAAVWVRRGVGSVMILFGLYAVFAAATSVPHLH